eukprot:scaffold77871_cov62-Phaeocystis_antarctica.AAC.2
MPIVLTTLLAEAFPGTAITTAIECRRLLLATLGARGQLAAVGAGAESRRIRTLGCCVQPPVGRFPDCGQTFLSSTSSAC